MKAVPYSETLSHPVYPVMPGRRINIIKICMRLSSRSKADVLASGLQQWISSIQLMKVACSQREATFIAVFFRREENFLSVVIFPVVLILRIKIMIKMN